MNQKANGSGIGHRSVRFDIPIGEHYDDFRRMFESAVPLFNRERAVELVERKAPWEEVVADVKAAAPHDFLLYWKLDLTPMMSLAGNTRRATEYLMGNHTIAETMYRRDPAVALYVPLRCAIYEIDGQTRFVIEQPSTALASLGSPESTQGGIELDRKLAKLLAALSVNTPEILSQAGKAA
ncbi:MAG TPA: DUF302 domain-containing protein [Candidatus Acidoferrum sp.]|jgi:hypothetical protein